MKRLVLAGVIAAFVGGAAPTLAAVAPNPGSQQSARSGNCIAYYSAQVIHNGSAPTLGVDAAHGHRGNEIKSLQASCGAQA